MNKNQFELALDQTKPSDWGHFEALSSAFLAAEHPSMRTMASPSGDGGRDSEIFSPDGGSYVAAQYSVTEYWAQKIRGTIKRLNENFKEVRILIYTSNQEIGAKADELKKECFSNKIYLDIRDRNWFTERAYLDENKTTSAETYFNAIGRPYLEGLQIIEKKQSALSGQEIKTALLYLGMQWEDANTNKNLTKVSYEALVRSALRKTTDKSWMKRADIQKAVHSYLPSQPFENIVQHVDTALHKLDKTVIKFRKSEDEFHLAFDEQERLSEKLASQALEDAALDKEICLSIATIDKSLGKNIVDLLGSIAKKILNMALLRSGENFASAVLAGKVQILDKDLVNSLIIEELVLHGKALKPTMEKHPLILFQTIDSAIKSNNQLIQKHLKTLSDTYTLFAFLRETNDVQKITQKIFSFGKIWLDTTLVLPLLADCLRTNKTERRFSSIIKNLISSGVDVYIANGAVNEILSHIKISIDCSRNSGTWKGKIPYLYAEYIQEGYNGVNFSDWAKNFRGLERPEQDIQEYLFSEYRIKHQDLTADYEKSPENLRLLVDQLWREAHEARRNSIKGTIESETTDILIKNDVISYLGVLERRSTEPTNELGYQHWWLTLDNTAWNIQKNLEEHLKPAPSSPLISLDFLVQNMSFGPTKNKLTRADEQLLPVLLDLDISQVIPAEIIRVAEKVRLENEGKPEYRIRRMVRDACDIARRLAGPLTKSTTMIK